jgi:hypothetical protein
VYNLLLIEAYFRLGDTEQAVKIADAVKNSVYQDMDYFLSLGVKYKNYLVYEKRVAFYSLEELRKMASTYKQTALEKEIEQKMQQFASTMFVPM